MGVVVRAKNQEMTANNDHMGSGAVGPAARAPR
jgi:hypothetical protein